MTSHSLADLRAAIGERAKVNEPLAAHTTFRIGGPADLFATAREINELVEWIQFASQHRVPVFILGNGSNILVRDGGIRGLVIENHCDQVTLNVTNENRAILTAESGASLPGIANRMARQGWSGLEWAIGVPSTVGAAIVGNAGAHGGCVADNLLSVTVFESDGAIHEMPKGELELDYRTSRFKKNKGKIILNGKFELKKEDPAACIARMNEYTDHRRRTQPTEPSVGSMFKNPPGEYAGKLIERAGLKGTRVGNVEVSLVHANFFVNRGGASAQDIERLIEIVRERVREIFGIQLELEIELVGEE